MCALFECAGFAVRELRGLGNAASTLGYLVGATKFDVSEEDLTASCNPLHGGEAACDHQRVFQVVAIGVKKTAAERNASAAAGCIFRVVFIPERARRRALQCERACGSRANRIFTLCTKP